MKVKDFSRLKEFGFESVNSSCYEKVLFYNDKGAISLLVFKDTKELKIYATNDESTEEKYYYDSERNEIAVEMHSFFDELAPVDTIIELYKAGILC